MKQHSVKNDNSDETDTKGIWKDTNSKKDKKKKKNEDTVLTYNIGDLLENIEIKN